jgi:hypothetical protein
MYGGINMTYLIIFFLIDSRIFKADNKNSIFLVIGIRISVGCGIEGLRNFLCIRRKASHVSRYLPSGIWSLTSSIVFITMNRSLSTAIK